MNKRTTTLLIIAAFVTNGCNVGREYLAPKTPVADSATVLQELDNRRFSAAEPVKDWWNTLEDKQLSALVEKALQHNLDVAIALANVEQARAIVDEAEFDRFPTARAYSDVTYQRISKQSINGSFTPVRKFTNHTAGFDTSWEIDLFGRVSQNIRAQKANLQATEADLRGAYVSVAAEVALNYVELRGTQQRLRVAIRNSNNIRETYDLTRTLADGGRGNDLDVSRAQTQWEQVQAGIPPLQAQISAAINRLGVLTGQSPETLRGELLPAKALPNVKPSVAVGNAQQLLARRPDVIAAERDLAASVAVYNLNVADFYPRISLGGTIGYISTNFNSLTQGSAFAYALGPSLTWAAFDIGRVDARVNQADAATKAAAANFQRTVLQALEETDNAMVALTREEQRRERLARAVQSSGRASRIARLRFNAGLDNFLDLLQTERQQIELEDQLALSDTATATNLIAVYKALGGGWEAVPERKEKPKASNEKAKQPAPVASKKSTEEKKPVAKATKQTPQQPAKPTATGAIPATGLKTAPQPMPFKPQHPPAAPKQVTRAAPAAPTAKTPPALPEELPFKRQRR